MKFLMPHELFASMHLNATTTPPPSEAAESVCSNTSTSDDHDQKVSSTSISASRSKRSLPWGFESDQPPAFLIKKHKSSSSSSSSSFSTNLSFVERKRSLSAATSTTRESAMKNQKPKKVREAAMKKQMPKKARDLDHRICHYFRTLRDNDAHQLH